MTITPPPNDPHNYNPTGDNNPQVAPAIAEKQAKFVMAMVQRRRLREELLPERTNIQLRKAVSKRMEQYKIDALDALHDIAMMELGDNSGQNQLKYMAAKLLAFAGEDGADKAPPDSKDFLTTLNDEFQKNAPRIKSVRERIVTFESEPKVIEG